jgi:hypothetical protein
MHVLLLAAETTVPGRTRRQALSIPLAVTMHDEGAAAGSEFGSR